MREAVVLVHGIWLIGLEMSRLRSRLTDCGYRVHQFHYPSLTATPADNARRLARYIDDLDADVVHLVAHSLGGLVLCHLFHDFPGVKPGRVVMLATPLRGSIVARRLDCWWSRWLLGRARNNALLGDGPGWPTGRPLGMIAGSRGSFGVGVLLTGSLPAPNDGTVSVAETDVSAVKEHLTVPYGHFGMLFAEPVAEAICRYLRSGRFAA
jgi:pimeloyl-ACP methyl ester carboxylesterase